MAKGPTKEMWKRILAIMIAVCVVAFGTVGIRLFGLMVVDAEEYQAKALSQQLKDITIEPKRGAIYDRNMNYLATSSTAWTIYISPNDIANDEERDLVVNGLSEILGIDAETIREKTLKNNQYEIIKRQVEKPQTDEVRAYISEHGLGSTIGISETTKRYYPNDNLASAVLGFVGSENQGLYGLESQYDSVLQGVSGRIIASKNAKGEDMPFTYQKIIEAQEGNSLVLTIDSTIQYYVENALSKAVIDNNVQQRGCAIAMNVNTGEILAMATKPDFNPNDPFTIYDTAEAARIETLTGEEKSKAISEAQYKQWRNKAITEVYYPGSVFKIVTGSAAIEEGVVNANSTFDCSGSIKIADTIFKCHKRSGHGHQNLMEVFQNSCNPAFILMGQGLGAETFFKYFKAYGLTEKTGIDLPGEEMSIYYTAEQMGPVELASESFGQTINLTPIQLITAIAAAVNGGYLVQPHVVKQIIDSDGNVVENIEPEVKRQVISEETSLFMRELLENVVTNGSGKNAYVAGYRVGGKTGTSQKQNLKNEDGSITKYISSFCGIAPADDPEIAIIVLLDEANVANYYGSAIAAPVVGQIFEEVLPYMDVEAVYTEEELAEMDIKVPDVQGKSVTEAKNAIKAAELNVTVIGDGDTVQKQVPAAQQSISKGGTVVIYTGDPLEQSMTEVPNFINMTPAQVNNAAAKAKINVKYSGTGVSGSQLLAYQQSVESGTKVEAGTTITVYFRHNDSSD
ncbi:MAG TPA: PASTA domain-containing protein [Firmicutes bacterium]|nr:PASTA domain-containing protein [Bacillota bacterium]